MTAVWYDAGSHAAGAALAAALPATIDVDVRATGVRVHTDALQEVDATAAELGLTADPAAVQTLRFGLDAADPATVRSFWEPVLGYRRAGAGCLEDPLRRDPSFAVRRLDEARPLRNRIHVDVVRPAAEVTRARAGREPTGPFGVMLADDEGNEADLVPGDPLPGTTDWCALFGAMTFYPQATAQFVTSVAELADAAGLPLLIDIRPEGVVLDSGKDAWEDGSGGADPAFAALARRIESAAEDFGLRADPAPLRFVQFGIDALDVPAIRAFWMRLLGYRADPRPDVTDIYDPRRLNPVLFFQQLQEPRPQRNRIRFELAVPDPEDRIAAAAGRVLSEKPYLVADPEGNEVVLRTTKTRPST